MTSRNDWHLISPYNITPELKHEGHENKGNDLQIKKLLFVKGIVPVSTLGNVVRTIQNKMCILILLLGCKGYSK